uniref:Uncharacterized protein n=1 Tax=Theileria annulata TaxID=5874 RepID=A0A3B0N3D7_THEAN
MERLFHPQSQLLDLLSQNSPKNEKESTLFHNLDKASDDQFKTKLRLDQSENHTLGVVCLPDNTQGLKFGSFNPLDPSSTFDDESIIWKSSLIDNTLSRQFRSKKCQIDTDCYFMVVEHKVDNTFLVSPVSNYFIFDSYVPPKSSESQPSKVDNIQERLKKMTRASDEDRPKPDEKQLPKKRKLSDIDKTNLGWDYENEEVSDDENTYLNNRTTYTEDDPFYDKNLTSYGESVKSMLILQKEQEVDEELKEYSDDEDSSSQVSVSSKVRVETAKSSQPKELTFEDKVLLFLSDNNNKVTVKVIRSHIN